MPTLLPDKDELAAMKAALTEADANLDVALPAAVAAFKDGEWSAERCESWVTLAKSEKPELWTKQPTAADSANAALERAAFEGKGDAVARSKLVKAVGEHAANATAIKYGLRGIGDFKSKGIAPATADKGDGKGDDKDTTTKNPWKLPPGPEADAARAAFIRSVGTKAASGLAKAAGVDLAGRPLRVA